MKWSASIRRPFGWGTALRLCLLLCPIPFALADAAAVATPDRVVTARGGSVELTLNLPLLADHGVELLDAPPPLDAPDGHLRWPPASLDGELELARSQDGLLLPRRGALRFEADLVLRRADGARLDLRELRLLPPAGIGEWALGDARGRILFTARAGFPRAPLAGGRYRSLLIDLQAAPGLADWVRSDSLAGLSVGRMALLLEHLPDSPQAASCPLNWPGTPGFSVDVALVALYQLQAQCAVAPCDGGASGSAVPRVKLTPAVTLRNDGTADVPWIAPFLTQLTPSQLELTHPYPQPDQHPMLVWNAYRLDAEGRLLQIGRSGLKHAFATENLGCLCNPDNHQILGPGCSDRYDIGSNDFSQALGPRSEVIAHDGRWGRCGSFFDPDCGGAQTQFGNGLSHRLLLPEADLSAAQHPGARWFVDAWYVVRDDINPLNTMGWREFVPQRINGNWLVPLSGSFSQGALLAPWAALPFAGSGWSQQQRVQTAEGEVLLGVRVSDLGHGRARYVYSLLNLSLGRPLTDGAEPDLRVLSNPGLFDMRIPLDGSRRPEAFDADAGDGVPPWQVGCSAQSLLATAPAGSSLAWGSMLSLSFIAEGPPQPGEVRLRVVGDAPAEAFAAPILVPARSPQLVFADGFSDPCDIGGGA